MQGGGGGASTRSASITQQRDAGRRSVCSKTYAHRLAPLGKLALHNSRSSTGTSRLSDKSDAMNTTERDMLIKPLARSSPTCYLLAVLSLLSSLPCFTMKFMSGKFQDETLLGLKCFALGERTKLLCINKIS